MNVGVRSGATEPEQGVDPGRQPRQDQPAATQTGSQQVRTQMPTHPRRSGEQTDGNKTETHLF